MANPIETVSQFAALIELMQDPSKFANLVDEAKKVRDENKKLVEAKTKVDAVDQYVDKAELDIGAKYSILENEIATQDAAIAQFKKDSTAKGSELAAREGKVLQREQSADLDAAKIVATQKDAAKLLKDAQDLMQANDKKAAELVAFEQKLNDKAAKIAALMA